MIKLSHPKTALFAALLGAALLLPTTALAEHHEDAMQEGESMEQDAMAGEDSMMAEDDAMADDAMADDAMGEDSMMEEDDAM